MKLTFFRNKKNNWICITTTGLICVEGSIQDPHKYVSENAGVKVEDNILYGFAGTAVEGTVANLTYTKQTPAVDVSAIIKLG